MKLKAIAVCIVVAAFIPSSVFAVCPNSPKDGIYSTYSGTMIGGRASEAWCSGAGPGQPGNTESTASWNGSALGTQWRVWGMAIDAAGAVETTRFVDASGNGWIDYATNYTGGQYWLDGNHLWGNGTGDFTGAVTYFEVTARVTLAGWQATGVASNIFMTGVFDDCPNCSIEYSISNAELVWRTGFTTPMPAGYPAFECGATTGELFGVCCVLAKIHCTPIATESSTWGAIKGFYR